MRRLSTSPNSTDRRAHPTLLWFSRPRTGGSILQLFTRAVFSVCAVAKSSGASFSNFISDWQEERPGLIYLRRSGRSWAPASRSPVAKVAPSSKVQFVRSSASCSMRFGATCPPEAFDAGRYDGHPQEEKSGVWSGCFSSPRFVGLLRAAFHRISRTPVPELSERVLPSESLERVPIC